MLAVVGYLLTEAGVRLPGNIAVDGTKFSDIPSGFAAVSAVPGAGLLQLFAFIGFLEIFVMKDITGGEFIGDFPTASSTTDGISLMLRPSCRSVQLN